MTEWVPKIETLRQAMAEGRESDALRIAAKFPVLGEHKARITRGWEATQRPEFYRALGKDPAALVADGVAAIRERYKL